MSVVSSPDQERLDAISEALARIVRRQDELEQRLRTIEGDRGPQGSVAPPAPAFIPLPRPPDFPKPPPLPAVSRPIPAAAPPKAALETTVGLNWINRIGVVTLIFAAAFGFEYAAENNWIGPGTRVALGILAAVIAAMGGELMRQRRHEVFAQGLTGLGIALSYLSLYASFTIYHIFPQSLAFILMVLTTGAAAALALRYESQAIAILGLLGGYLTPALVSTGEDHPWVLFGYTFLVNIGALALTRFRRWVAMEYLALAATAILYLGWYGSWFNDQNRTVATVFALVFYFQFTISESRPLWILAQLLAALSTPFLWPGAAGVLTLALVYAVAGLVIAEARQWPHAPPWTLFGYGLSYLLWWETHGAPAGRELIFGLLSCGFLVFTLWIAWRAVSKKRALGNPELVVLAANGAGYFGASYPLLDPQYHAYMGAFTVLLGGIHLGLARLLTNPSSDREEDQWPSLLAAGVTLGFLTLAIPIQLAGFRITVAWSLEAAALAWLAARFQNGRLRFSSWLVFVLVGCRLLFIDAWIYRAGRDFPAIVNARFLTFAVAAASLWLAARFAKTGLEAATPYLAGHVALLAALAMEVVGWAERSAPAADRWSTESTAISILMALYALALIGLGVITSTSINRILGLGLFGIVIAKLYLSDVWELGMGFRITAFLGLGGLLLLVSYLYSRFKPTIEKLWKDDD